MKNVLSIFVLLMLFTGINAQEKSEMQTIDVSGSAEVQVAPDEIIFSLDVTDVDVDLQKAKSMNDATVAKVLALTKGFGVQPQDVKTDFISVNKKYEYYRDKDKKIYDEDGDEISQKTFKGFEVSKTVIVKLKDVSRFEQFFSEVLKTGITDINSVKFQTSKMREMRDKAREMAMKAAYEKATAMTAAIGQNIGKAISIVEEGGSSRGYAQNNFSANANTTVTSGNYSASESLATFAPGTITVEAAVKVKFLLK